MDEEESPFSRVPRPGRHEDRTPLTFEGQMEAVGRFSGGLASRLHPVVRITVAVVALAFVVLTIVLPLLNR